MNANREALRDEVRMGDGVFLSSEDPPGHPEGKACVVQPKAFL
jgi:ribosomal protein L16/L10AE